jgi:hypothetical protein
MRRANCRLSHPMRAVHADTAAERAKSERDRADAQRARDEQSRSENAR